MPYLPDPAHLRVASYNIRKTRGLDQRRDPARILGVINQLNADVIALQEADRRLGNRPSALCRTLIQSETDYQVVNLATNDVSLGWHGNAILVRKGMRVANIARIDLPGLEPRGAVRVRIEHSGVLDIVGTHLGLTRYHRRHQLRALADHLQGSGQAILLGDFNEWSLRKGLEPIRDRFDVKAPGRTYHAAQPLAALDRIAVSKGMDVRATGVEDGPLARRASDHLPIWADVVLAPDIAAISNRALVPSPCAADRV